MEFLKKSDTKKDTEHVKEISSLVEKRLVKFSKKTEKKIEKLSYEELQDLNEILKMADYILCKYENKKEIRSLLKDFVEIINSSSDSINYLDDEIDELVLNAEDAIKRIKDIQSNVSESLSFDRPSKKNTNTNAEPEKGANNLTNSSRPVYTQEYQQTSAVKTEQVI